MRGGTPSGRRRGGLPVVEYRGTPRAIGRGHAGLDGDKDGRSHRDDQECEDREFHQLLASIADGSLPERRRGRACRPPAQSHGHFAYGSRVLRLVKYPAIFGPIKMIEATEATVTMPISNPYSTRSWPASSRTNRVN